jgi:hypothetical protein
MKHCNFMTLTYFFDQKKIHKFSRKIENTRHPLLMATELREDS